MKLNYKTKGIAVLLLMTASIVAFNTAMNEVQSFSDYSDASLHPTFWFTCKGNYSVDKSASSSMMKNGRIPLAVNELGIATFDFQITIQADSLDDINNMAIDPDDDSIAEDELNIGAPSFLGSKSYLIENETGIDATDGEHYFYSSSFDSDTYPYLLLTDCSTPSDTASKIIINTSGGNQTLYSDIIIGRASDEFWFRLDRHYNGATINNITVQDMTFADLYLFALSGTDQWADSRYIDIYVSESENTATVTGASMQMINQPAAWNTGEGLKRPDGMTAQGWLDSVTKADILASRSPYWEKPAYVRASGWLEARDLEQDIEQAIAEKEGIDESAVRDYALSSGVGFWELSNSDNFDAINRIIRAEAETTSDVQSFVNSVAEQTIPHSSMLLGVDDSIMNKMPSQDDLVYIEDIGDFFKQAADKVYDITNGAIAALGTGANQVSQWGMDLVSGAFNTGSNVLNGIVDSTGEIAQSLIGTVAQTAEVLNPLSGITGWFKSLPWIWLGVIAIVAVVLIVVITAVVTNYRKTAVGVAKSGAIKGDVKATADLKDLMKL